jgi:hypothetical protein
MFSQVQIYKTKYKAGSGKPGNTAEVQQGFSFAYEYSYEGSSSRGQQKTEHYVTSGSLSVDFDATIPYCPRLSTSFRAQEVVTEYQAWIAIEGAFYLSVASFHSPDCSDHCCTENHCVCKVCK